MTTDIDSEPQIGRLYWTAHTNLEGDSGPTDPLRFDMYVQRLGNHASFRDHQPHRASALPEHGLRRPRRDRHRWRIGPRAAQAFLPFERGWALSMIIAAEGRIKLGAGGARIAPGVPRPARRQQVLAHYRTIAGRTSIRPPAYRLLKAQEAQGGLGAYLITLRQFGFVHPDSLALPRSVTSWRKRSPRGVRGGRLGTLAADTPCDRGLLARMGGVLTLAGATDDERSLVGHAVFDSERSVVGQVVGRMRAARPDTSEPEALLAGIARDRRRSHRACSGVRAGVRAAAHRGAAIVRVARRADARAPRRRRHFRCLDGDPLDAAATDVVRAASAVTALREIPGLESVSRLAREIAAGRDA